MSWKSKFCTIEGCRGKDTETTTRTSRYVDSSSHHSAKFPEPKYKILCPPSKHAMNCSSFIWQLKAILHFWPFLSNYYVLGIGRCHQVQVECFASGAMPGHKKLHLRPYYTGYTFLFLFQLCMQVLPSISWNLHLSFAHFYSFQVMKLHSAQIASMSISWILFLSRYICIWIWVLWWKVNQCIIWLSRIWI